MYISKPENMKPVKNVIFFPSKEQLKESWKLEKND